LGLGFGYRHSEPRVIFVPGHVRAPLNLELEKPVRLENAKNVSAIRPNNLVAGNVLKNDK
jgi:hypothetical protein